MIKDLKCDSCPGLYDTIVLKVANNKLLFKCTIRSCRSAGLLECSSCSLAEEDKDNIRKKEIPYKSVSTWGMQSYGAGREDGTNRCAYMLLSGGIATSRDGGALRNWRCAGWLPPALRQHVSASGLRPSVLSGDL